MLHNVTHNEGQSSEATRGLCPSWNYTDVPGTGPLADGEEMIRNGHTKFTNMFMEPFCGHPGPLSDTAEETPTSGKTGSLQESVSIMGIAAPGCGSLSAQNTEQHRTKSDVPIQELHRASLPCTDPPHPRLKSVPKGTNTGLQAMATTDPWDSWHCQSGDGFIEWPTGRAWRSDHCGQLLTSPLCHPGQTT